MRCLKNRVFGVVVSVLGCVMVMLAGTARGEELSRVALVVGIAQYERVGTLPNPINDATDIGDKLASIGFQVTRVSNADYSTLRRALKRFKDRASKSDVAVLYYAGHGIEIGSTNYLIPSDAALKDASDIAFEAIPLENAMAAVEGARSLSLVIVDACRDNPFRANMRLGSTTRSIGRGLVGVEPLGHTLVAYAAREGTVAADGLGRNSPYAKALIEYLPQSGIELGLMFRKVRDRVLELTNGAQEPFLYGSMSAEPFYFVDDSVQVAAQTPERETAEISPLALDQMLWETVKDSDQPEDYRAYLRLFEQGAHTQEARFQLTHLINLERTRAAKEKEVAELVLSEPARPFSFGPSAGQASGAIDFSAGIGLTEFKAFETPLHEGPSDDLVEVPAESPNDAELAPSKVETPGDTPGKPVVFEANLARFDVPEIVAKPPKPGAGTASAGHNADEPELIANQFTRQRMKRQRRVAALVMSSETPDAAIPEASLEDDQSTDEFVDFDFDLDRGNWLEVQEALTTLGFNPGTIDGLPGPETRQAIREWQSEQGLASSGFLEDEGRERLFRDARAHLARLSRVSPSNTNAAPLSPFSTTTRRASTRPTAPVPFLTMDTVAGRWVGRALGYNGRDAFSFSLTLSAVGEAFGGRFTEQASDYQQASLAGIGEPADRGDVEYKGKVLGEVNGKRTLEFVKTYENAAPIERQVSYTGRLTASGRIEGQWRAGRRAGTFIMKRQ